MRHLIFRIFLIFIFGLLFFVYIFPWTNYNINMPFSGNQYRLGLDLQGGIELDYKVDLSQLEDGDEDSKSREKEIVEGLKSIIDKRVESLNINDSEINDASYGGEKHIIVQIPLKGNDSLENSNNIEKAKEAIGKVVKIAFKEKRGEITQEDLLLREEIATKAFDEIKSGENFSVISDKNKLNYENVDTGIISKYSEILDEKENQDIDESSLNEVTLLNGNQGFLLSKKTEETKIEYLFISKSPSEWKDAVDSEGRVLNDKYFVKSSVQFNEAFNPMIELVFNNEGAEIFGELSERLVGQKMAIFVGGEMLTDPVINEPIYGGKAVITGNYTAVEAKELSQDINTGVVPAPIYLTSEKTIDSKIGTSSLEKLIIAGISGFFIIFLFLIFTYRVSGLMASVALFLYIVLILVIVKMFGIVLTLASIAGLILSIGMAIDANILIFERIRDELKKGNNILESTDIGFRKSWSAIWDSNFTGLIVALILFIFGINLIKGFGLMLAIGIVVSLFTVMWISKVLLFYISLKIKNTRVFIGMKK